MATKETRRADSKLTQAREIVKIKSTTKTVTTKVKEQVRKSCALQEKESSPIRTYISQQNWEVENAYTGKRMMIRKGQLILLLDYQYFGTMDGRRFIHLHPEMDLIIDKSTDCCMLRPTGKNAPLLWSYRV